MSELKDTVSFRSSSPGLAVVEQLHLPDQIVWNEGENIYRPSPRPLAEFLSTVELISHSTFPGSNQDGSLLVFLEQDCMEKMQAHAHQEILREQAGILCGQVFSNGDEQYYVTITSTIAADAHAGAAHFRFHERSWDEVWRKMEPGSNVIGWYHTHPGMGAFLSQTDLRTQQRHFQSPWQLAVVIDPVGRETRIFSGRTGVKVPENSCFYYLQKP